jgi:histidyl-tRNA synthetase
MAVSTHTFQAPKGTRDFYPQDLAVRRYIESVWREVSINHGFDEIDGPTFEHLDLYTIKSGPGIESELFSFRRSGGDTDYALRPEFTPTLARMYAAQAGSLPKPTKWFSIGPYFRAERPQRGRLREHVQLNVDIIGAGVEGTWQAQIDVELLSVVASLLRGLGLGPEKVRIKLGQRKAVVHRLEEYGRSEDERDEDLALLDARPKLRPDEYRKLATECGWPDELIRFYDPEHRAIVRMDVDPESLDLDESEIENIKSKRLDPHDLFYQIDHAGLSEWCEFDSMIIRGLAYYTDLIFEIHEATGKERAIAGGGRYDNLVELFGGPSTAACGFAMGDVVLRLVLEDHGLLKPAEQYMPRPDVFVITARDEEPQTNFTPTISELRQAQLHVRHSYKATRNVGKLLSEANKARARFAVILGKELDEGNVVLKDLQSGEQEEIARETLIDVLRTKLATCEGG